jgi:hypothetical protein
LTFFLLPLPLQGLCVRSEPSPFFSFSHFVLHPGQTSLVLRSCYGLTTSRNEGLLLLHFRSVCSVIHDSLDCPHRLLCVSIFLAIAFAASDALCQSGYSTSYNRVSKIGLSLAVPIGNLSLPQVPGSSSMLRSVSILRNSQLHVRSSVIEDVASRLFVRFKTSRVDSSSASRRRE